MILTKTAYHEFICNSVPPTYHVSIREQWFVKNDLHYYTVEKKDEDETWNQVFSLCGAEAEHKPLIDANSILPFDTIINL